MCIRDRYSGVSGIYKITNLLNRKCYIGQSADLGRRFRVYVREATDVSDDKEYRSIIQAMREDEMCIRDRSMASSDMDSRINDTR